MALDALEDGLRDPRREEAAAVPLGRRVARAVAGGLPLASALHGLHGALGSVLQACAGVEARAAVELVGASGRLVERVAAAAVAEVEAAHRAILRRRAAQLDQMREAAGALAAASVDVDGALAQIARTTAETLRCDWGAVALPEADGRLVIAAAVGRGSGFVQRWTLRVADGFAGAALESEHAWITTDPAEIPYEGEERPEAVIAVALRDAAGTPVGLVFCGRDGGEPLGSDEVALADGVAEIAGRVLAAARSSTGARRLSEQVALLRRARRRRARGRRGRRALAARVRRLRARRRRGRARAPARPAPQRRRDPRGARRLARARRRARRTRDAGCRGRAARRARRQRGQLRGAALGAGPGPARGGERVRRADQDIGPPARTARGRAPQRRDADRRRARARAARGLARAGSTWRSASDGARRRRRCRCARSATRSSPASTPEPSHAPPRATHRPRSAPSAPSSTSSGRTARRSRERTGRSTSRARPASPSPSPRCATTSRRSPAATPRASRRSPARARRSCSRCRCAAAGAPSACCSSPSRDRESARSASASAPLIVFASRTADALRQAAERSEVERRVRDAEALLEAVAPRGALTASGLVDAAIALTGADAAGLCAREPDGSLRVLHEHELPDEAPALGARDARRQRRSPAGRRRRGSRGRCPARRRAPASRVSARPSPRRCATATRRSGCSWSGFTRAGRPQRRGRDHRPPGPAGRGGARRERARAPRPRGCRCARPSSGAARPSARRASPRSRSSRAPRSRARPATRRSRTPSRA